jgi:hypothetical protein
MNAKLSRWIILLLALVCVAQAASAFSIKTESINPASGNLEPGQQVTVHEVITYNMLTTSGNDESFDFSTGLSSPVWTFIVYRDGIAINTVTKTGYYPSMTEFELSYGEGDISLDVQLRGTVPTTTSGTLEVIKIEHTKSEEVMDDHIVTRTVVNPTEVQNTLTARQQQLTDLKADIDEKAALGVDVSAAQAKYNSAKQSLDSAASASPSQAATLLSSAKTDMDAAAALLDKAWAEKSVSDAATTLENLDGMITYFVDNRSMGSDPQVIAIITKRESAVQFYTQAQDNLNTGNYPLARTKATDATNKANEALKDANALKTQIGEGFNLNVGGNALLYVGIGVVLILIVVGVVVYRKRTRWDELG